MNELPEGVKRWAPGIEVAQNSIPTPRKLEVTRMFEREDGDWIAVSDLPTIIAAERERVLDLLEADGWAVRGSNALSRDLRAAFDSTKGEDTR